MHFFAIFQFLVKIIILKLDCFDWKNKIKSYFCFRILNFIAIFLTSYYFLLINLRELKYNRLVNTNSIRKCYGTQEITSSSRIVPPGF